MIVGTVGGGGRDGVHRVRSIASPVSESVVVFSPLAKREILRRRPVAILSTATAVFISVFTEPAVAVTKRRIGKHPPRQ